MDIDITKQSAVNIDYKNTSEFDLSIDVKKDGVAYDMTDKTIRMMIKKNRDYQSYVYNLTSGTDIIISTANLTFSKVMNLPRDIYYYDIYNVTDSDFIMGGLIKVERNITTATITSLESEDDEYIALED